VSDDHSYEVAITARAARDLERLPEKVAAACMEFIFGPLVDNPRKLGKPLRDDLAGLYSARRGDYRVIYGVDDRNQRVEVIHIARRSDVYRQ
jgi:mRNA interferase RelE/StbE